MEVTRWAWPIVAGGCYRTGTSLVRRLLDAHPRIHCGPEVPFFRDFYGDYRNDVLHHLRFTTAARALLPEDELLAVLGRAFLELHEAAARRHGKARWADKAPENVLHLQAWGRLLGERWLFIHVARNPLDTLASMKERPFPLTLPSELDARVSLYRRFVEAGLEFEADHPERYRCVLYEELTSEPGRVVEGLMTWLGEPFDRGQLAFNDLPHQQGLEDPKIAETTAVHNESVGRWTSLLSRQEADEIRARTADLWPLFDPDGRYWTAALP